MSLTNFSLNSFLLPLLFIAPGAVVVVLAVALNWGR